MKLSRFENLHYSLEDDDVEFGERVHVKNSKGEVNVKNISSDSQDSSTTSSVDDNIDTFVVTSSLNVDTSAGSQVTKNTPKTQCNTSNASTADVGTTPDRADLLDNYNPFSGNTINDLADSAVNSSIGDLSSSVNNSKGSVDLGSSGISADGNSTSPSSNSTGSSSEGKSSSTCSDSLLSSLLSKFDQVSSDVKSAVGNDLYTMGKGAWEGFGLASGGIGCVFWGLIDYLSGDNGSLVECVVNRVVNGVQAVFDGVQALGHFIGSLFGFNSSDDSGSGSQAALDASMSNYIANSTIETNGLSGDDINALTDMSWANGIDFGDDSSNSSTGDYGSPDCQVTELGSDDSGDYYGGDLSSYDIDFTGLSESDMSALTDMSWADSIDFGDYSQPLNWGLTAGGCAGDYGRSEYRGLC